MEGNGKPPRADALAELVQVARRAEAEGDTDIPQKVFARIVQAFVIGEITRSQRETLFHKLFAEDRGRTRPD